MCKYRDATEELLRIMWTMLGSSPMMTAEWPLGTVRQGCARGHVGRNRETIAEGGLVVVRAGWEVGEVREEIIARNGPMICPEKQAEAYAVKIGW